MRFAFERPCGPNIDKDLFDTESEKLPPNTGSAGIWVQSCSINLMISERFLSVPDQKPDWFASFCEVNKKSLWPVLNNTFISILIFTR